MATKATVGTYTADAIQNRQFPECVREAPTLYVGSLGADALLHFIREIVDNIIDEMLQGRAGAGVIQIDASGTCAVFDDGPGVPFGRTKVLNDTMPTLQAAFGALNTSGKYRGNAYRGAGGVHGQGAKAVNALSTKFEAWTMHADNPQRWEYVAFSKGVRIAYAVGAKVPNPPLNPVTNALPRRGTVVRWTPDLSIVGKGSRVSGADLNAWLKIKSYFVPEGKFFLVSPKGAVTTYSQPGGASAYVEHRFAELKIDTPMDKVFTFTSDLVEVAATWSEHGECALQAFTNAIYNSERGVHFTAFFTAVFAALQPHRRKRDDFTAVDLREGCVGLVNARLDAPRFDSQTKEKLVDERAGAPVTRELTEALAKFFAANKAFAIRLCERAQSIKALRAKFSADKALITAMSKRKKAGLPAKASTAPDCTVEERELIIVEGESAGGGARTARDAYYQELLPLRGKPLNALRAKTDQLLKSEEIMHVLNMIGWDPKREDPLSTRRVGRVVLLSDPDPDGPLHGDTLVTVRIDKVWIRVTIEQLALETRPYQVLTWTGRAFAVAEAGMARVTGHVTEYVKLSFEDGSTERCSMDHKWPVQSRGKNLHRGTLDTSTNLRWVPASELKAGDVLDAAPSEIRTQDKVVSFVGLSMRSTRRVVKVKTQKLHAPEPVYCLTVPSTGNFVLSNGVISANCHINTLVLAAIWKCAPALIQDGRVYVVESPEYYAVHNGEPFTGSTAEDVRLQVEKVGGKASVHHIKGWGEINAKLIGMLALNPGTRRLRRISVTEEGAAMFVNIMSDGAETRRALLGI